MLLFNAILLWVFCIALVLNPTLSAGWFWDFGNGLGFAAIAGMLYLTVSSGRPLNVTRHQHLGYVVLLFCAVHALWFLIGDPAVVEYVRPGAPLYMWSGLIGLLTLGILMTIAVLPDRYRVHSEHKSFRYWHLILAIFTLAAAMYHVVGSGYYLTSWIQIVALVAMAAIAGLSRKFRQKVASIPLTSVSACLTISFVSATLFALVHNL